MGTFVLALHSHLPYCRGAGRWPHGEEWIHEAVLGTYLPLLVLLQDLREAGVPYRIVIGLTPILIEQLADHDIDVRNLEYIDDQIRRAEKDGGRFVDAGDHARAALADFYLGSYRRLREAYVGRFGRDLVGAFADLARSGHVEVLTSAATHGYLPLLDRASVDAQLRVGRRSTRRLLGLDPTGIWLPECAYAPGLETVLASHGITHFFTDAALLPGHARPAGQIARRANGDGRKLFGYIFVIGTAAGTIFTNDAAVLIFTPLVWRLIEDVREDDARQCETRCGMLALLRSA